MAALPFLSVIRSSRNKTLKSVFQNFSLSIFTQSGKSERPLNCWIVLLKPCLNTLRFCVKNDSILCTEDQQREERQEQHFGMLVFFIVIQFSSCNLSSVQRLLVLETKMICL